MGIEDKILNAIGNADEYLLRAHKYVSEKANEYLGVSNYELSTLAAVIPPVVWGVNITYNVMNGISYPGLVEFSDKFLFGCFSVLGFLRATLNVLRGLEYSFTGTISTDKDKKDKGRRIEFLLFGAMSGILRVTPLYEPLFDEFLGQVSFASFGISSSTYFLGEDYIPPKKGKVREGLEKMADSARQRLPFAGPSPA